RRAWIGPVDVLRRQRHRLTLLNPSVEQQAQKQIGPRVRLVGGAQGVSLRQQPLNLGLGQHRLQGRRAGSLEQGRRRVVGQNFFFPQEAKEHFERCHAACV